MITIVTYLWEDETRHKRGYVCEWEHVLTLQSMLERNVTVPYRFVCVTDHVDGNVQSYHGVDTVPLDMRKHIPGTVYARLMQQNGEWCRKNLGDRVLSVDLDVAITGNIDHILNRMEDYVIWRNPNYPLPGRAFYQSSVQLFTAGARQCLWDDFDTVETPKWVNRRFGGAEQAWISERLEWHEAFFCDEDGVYGAGRLLDGGTYAEENKDVYTELPANACIVSFPGARAPWQKEVQAKHPWLKDHYK